MKRLTYLKLILVIFCLLLSGCRGYRSEKPPYHMNPNLDWQPKYKAQALSAPFVEGTVPFGRSVEPTKMEQLNLNSGSNSYVNTGKYSSGEWAQNIPIDVNEKVLKRGQERYNIYCSVCHDKSGLGNGLVVQKGYAPPPSFYSDRVLNMKNGYIYWVITHGIRNMKGYKNQIELEDRWAIVAYVRALQKTKTAK